VLNDDLRVEHVVLEGVLVSADVDGGGHERVPVVQVVELGGDPVLVLEGLPEEELRPEEELVVVAAEVLHVVFDHDLDRIVEVVKEKGLVVSGDATSESVLEQANLEHAKAIVTTLPTDAQNVFIALTARNLAPNVQIIATAEEASSCRKLRQAGANKIVMPQRVGAQQMERMITRPTTADLFELVAETSDMEMELDELVIGPGNHLFGKTIGDSGLRDEYGLLVIGIKKPDGRLVFNPPSSQVIEADDTLIVIGSFNKIAKLKGSHGGAEGPR